MFDAKRFEELKKKEKKGLTSAEHQELAKLHGLKAKQLEEQEGRLPKLVKMIEAEGWDAKEAASAIMALPIFKWADKVKNAGLKGALPDWVEDMKKDWPTKAEAMKGALMEQGKQWVELVYAPPKPKKEKKQKKA